MLKIVIADDEERICQLIRALVDWQSLSMEIAGIAHNGLEACELVKDIRPDILITDIRMPGCNGMELIEQAKSSAPELEIIVISGYAHFEYAQQAIKYGVGDYLLKPISKTELTATLQKLKERISRKKEVEQDKAARQRREQMDVCRLRADLLEKLGGQNPPQLSAESLWETYRFRVKEGYLQAFCLKMDRGRGALSEASVAAIMEKALEALRQGLEPHCADVMLHVSGYSCVGIIHYEKEDAEKIRKLLKNCLNQMEAKKDLFGAVTFSIALGSAVEDPRDLERSMKEALLLVQDRIIRGTGRLLERIGEPSALKESGILEKYLREMMGAVELMSIVQSDVAVNLLAEEIQSVRDVRGCEIFELVYSAADIFSARMQMEDRTEKLEEFRRQCEQCRDTDELLGCLRVFQKLYIGEMLQNRENDAIRPIRKAKEYIQEHYSEPITQEEVSGAVGLSAAYFSMLFKKTEGEGFAKYLIKVRMEQAKRLLRETNIPVAEICRRVGYNDLKHFTHTFEKFSGVKPATYRKLYG